MSKNYIKNLETGKIELHFEKADYQALTAEQKTEIKRSYLWSNYAKAWVSRSINNQRQAIQTAQKLGFTEGEKQGERLSYAEQLERKAERAEARADRMEEHADNATKRAQGLQSSFNECRKDWSWLTQPNINSGGGRAFTNQRNRIIARYEKGFDEYRKSEYFQGRAETARGTANMTQLKDPIYLHNRIKECKSSIKKLEANAVNYDDKLYRIENGEVITNYKGDPIPAESFKTWLENTLEKLEYEIDKQAFMENHLDEIGGNRFSKENIKVGYIVKLPRWGSVEVTGTGPVNFTYKHDLGNHKGWPGQEPYAAILEIVESVELKEINSIDNPYKVGDILCAHRPADNSVYRAFQVIKTTASGVKIQRIAVENGTPVKDNFISEKAMQKKIVKSKFREWVGVYENDWQLHKYTPKAEQIAVNA